MLIYFVKIGEKDMKKETKLIRIPVLVGSTI